MTTTTSAPAVRTPDAAPRATRILQIGGLAGPGGDAGGVWRVAAGQTTLLRDAGLPVQLMGGWLGPVPADVHDADLYRVRRPLPGAKLRGLVSLRWLAAVWRAAGRADVVHVHLARDFIATAAVVVAGLRGRPVVAQTHGMLTVPSSRAIALFDRVVRPWYLRFVRTWIALTEAEVADLVALGVDHSRIRRLHNSVPSHDVRWRRPGRPRFLFASRLAARKQPLVFLDAADRLLGAGREAEFVLAGPDQGEGEAVAAAIERSPHRERLRSVGYVDSEAVLGLLQESTAMVLPSRREIFPMIAVEALQVGTPVILTADCGMADDLAAAGAALIVEPETGAVEEAIDRLLADDRLLLDLHERGARYFADRLSPQALVRDLQRIYSEFAD